MGRKEGRSAGGGEGEGDKCLKVFGVDASAAFDWVFVFAALRDASELEEESDESESESESDAELEDEATTGLGSDVGGCADSLLEDESDSEEEEDSELETAALLFRFLVLFLGAGGIEVDEGSPNLGLGVQKFDHHQWNRLHLLSFRVMSRHILLCQHDHGSLNQYCKEHPSRPHNQTQKKN